MFKRILKFFRFLADFGDWVAYQDIQALKERRECKCKGSTYHIL